MSIRLFLIFSLIIASPAAAQDLALPYPVEASAARPAVTDSYLLPIAAWDGRAVPVRKLEGIVDRRAYQLAAGSASPLEVLAPIRAALIAQGYEVLLDCETRSCGGFDFRFSTEVMSEPDMHVDLGDFRFLSAMRGEGEGISLMVSRSAMAAFVQVIHVGDRPLPDPAQGTAPQPAPEVAPAAPMTAIDIPVVEGGLTTRMTAGLGVALDDLVFESGASSLRAGDYASLAELAAWLKADEARRVILVGHTDISGAYDANVALSQKRAAAVRNALVSDLGVAAKQVSAQGVGPLAPRASNHSDEGRALNRRVEAVPGT